MSIILTFVVVAALIGGIVALDNRQQRQQRERWDAEDPFPPNPREGVYHNDLCDENYGLGPCNCPNGAWARRSGPSQGTGS